MRFLKSHSGDGGVWVRLSREEVAAFSGPLTAVHPVLIKFLKGIREREWEKKEPVFRIEEVS